MGNGEIDSINTGAVCSPTNNGQGKCAHEDFTLVAEHACSKNLECVSNQVSRVVMVCGDISCDSCIDCLMVLYSPPFFPFFFNFFFNFFSVQCIGNGGGLLAAFSPENPEGQCGYDEGTRGGTCSCPIDPPEIVEYHEAFSTVCTFFANDVFPDTRCSENLSFGAVVAVEYMPLCVSFCEDNLAQFQSYWQSGTEQISIEVPLITFTWEIEIAPHPAPEGYNDYNPSRAVSAADPLISRSLCVDTLE